MKRFALFHPAALFCYFACVLIMVMFSMHPVLVALSAVGSFCFLAVLSTRAEMLRTGGLYLLLFLLLTALNPLFVHSGATPLFFLNGNPVTLEALLRGMAEGAMLVSVILWCKCYTRVMTSDKFLYLFGRLSPKIALMISMALRFVPDLGRQAKRIRSAQKTLGLYSTASYFERFRSEIRVFSALLTWAIENAVETADSMRARGYGLKGRSTFSIFIFRRQDALLAAASLAVLALALWANWNGSLAFHYYPRPAPVAADLPAMLVYTCVFALMIIPFILEVEGNVHWKYLRSKI